MEFVTKKLTEKAETYLTENFKISIMFLIAVLILIASGISDKNITDLIKKDK